jgi:hypothetical protein
LSAIEELRDKAKTGVQSPELRSARALETIALELSAIRAVMYRQAKATKELAEMVASDLDPYGLDDDDDDFA